MPAVEYFGWLRSIGDKDLNGFPSSEWRQCGDWFQIIGMFSTVSKPGLSLPPVILSPADAARVNPSVRVTWSSVYGATGYALDFAPEGGSYTQQDISDTTTALQNFGINQAIPPENFL